MSAAARASPTRLRPRSPVGHAPCPKVETSALSPQSPARRSPQRVRSARSRAQSCSSASWRNRRVAGGSLDSRATAPALRKQQGSRRGLLYHTSSRRAKDSGRALRRRGKAGRASTSPRRQSRSKRARRTQAIARVSRVSAASERRPLSRFPERLDATEAARQPSK
eukprot:Amastigsp_a843332_8.p2 type:complete len:166 gc:universal Amastigsp_a843332_8:505-8(-)